MKVARSGRIQIQEIPDAARGSITVFERGLPFSVKRVYAIHGVTDLRAVRGGHAHKKNDQALFMLKGALTLNLDDGVIQESVRVAAGEAGVLLRPMLWHSMSDFTEDAIALVLASEPYDESDYIRDYEEFKKHESPVQ
ncbi:MAG: FdtA/QdtA family cupin domain-containing protein [Patescibacteria group bacterium]